MRWLTRNIASARQCGFDDAVFGACIHTYILAWLQAYVLACLHTFLHIYILLLDLKHVYKYHVCFEAHVAMHACGCIRGKPRTTARSSTLCIVHCRCGLGAWDRDVMESRYSNMFMPAMSHVKSVNFHLNRSRGIRFRLRQTASSVKRSRKDVIDVSDTSYNRARPRFDIQDDTMSGFLIRRI